jgi:WD40 repeat protein
MNDPGAYTTLGRYRLMRRIGRGGMGEVWLAEDPRLQRQVALKVLPLRRRDDEGFLARFEREARTAASLHHPHILPVHDFGQEHLPGDQIVSYLVMSYVSGGSLDDRLERLALTHDEALAYLLQVAEAIDYAHAHNIVHRDIKPANMLLREDNWLLLTDFGIAHILMGADETATGKFLGTPAYMAPEQSQGHAVPASDIYSLAVIAYQFFTGRVPFQADNPYALAFQHSFAAPTSPRVYNPALSPEFEVALLTGLAKEPAQRPPSALAFVTGLRQALEAPSPPTIRSEQLVKPSQSEEPSQQAARLSRRRLLLGAGAGALLIGGGAAAYIATSAHTGPVTLKSTATAVHPRPSPTASASAPLTISGAFTGPVASMVWSPVKNVLAAWGGDSQGLLVLWDFTSAGPSSAPAQLAQQDIIYDDVLLSWSPNGEMLAVANGGSSSSGARSSVPIYAANLSGTLPGLDGTTIVSPTYYFKGLCWASNSSLITLVDDKNGSGSGPQAILDVWNVQRPGQELLAVTLEELLTATQSVNTNLLALSPDGSTLAVGTSSGLLLGQLDMSTRPPVWKQIGSPLQPDSGEGSGGGVGQVAWSPDGRYVAAVLAYPPDDAIVGVWDATRQYTPIMSQLDQASVPTTLTSLAWSPTSRPPLLALGGNNSNVYLWSVGSRSNAVRILSGNVLGVVIALAWSADGRWLAASYNDPAETIVIWRM